MQWSGKHCGLLQKEWRAQSSTAKRVELCCKQCRECREHSTPMQMEWRVQYSTANGVERTVLHCKKSGESGALQQTEHRVQTAQYSNAMEWRAQCLSTTCGAAEHHALH